MNETNTQLKRRDLLRLGAAGACLGTLIHHRTDANETQPTLEPEKASGEWVDVNVYLPDWPFRRLPIETTTELVQMLRRQGVTEAWTGSFDGVFHKDIAAANARLHQQCQEHGDGLLVPFGSINPSTLDWREDLRRCAQDFQMPGIRLHPNYHGYTLNDACFRECLTEAGKRNLIVQLVPWLEDDRHHHPMMPIPKLDLASLPDTLAAVGDVRIVLSNGFRSVGGQVTPILKLPSVWVDFAMLDVINGLADLLKEVDVDRVVFGSYAPMFYFDSVRLKMLETVLTSEQNDSIRFGNAKGLVTA